MLASPLVPPHRSLVVRYCLGVYHALLAIGATGAGTLDKVAGPVGEALIMTGVGLAVAIPAVMAYNWLTRQQPVWEPAWMPSRSNCSPSCRRDRPSRAASQMRAESRPPCAPSKPRSPLIGDSHGLCQF